MESSKLHFNIPEHNLPKLTERIEKLNRRASKLGCPQILYFVGDSYFLHLDRNGDETQDQTKAVRSIRMFKVAVVGESPKLNGWIFVAKLQHEDGANILRIAPTFEGQLPQGYRTSASICDHCQTDRNRKDTYVVMNEAGEFKQVGRNCLRDFLGHVSAQAAAEWAEVLFDLSDICNGFGGLGGSLFYVPLETLLAQVAHICKTSGYVTRKQAQEEWGRTATPHMLFNLNTNSRVADELKSLNDSITDAERELAAAAREWAQGISPEGASDFEWNLRTMAGKDAVSYREVGIAAYVVPAYLRHLETEADRLAREARAEAARLAREARGVPEFIGTVGQRQEFDLTVKLTRTFETQFGTSTMVIFEDANGNTAKWFASGCVTADWEAGQSYHVKATVKGHEEYKGRPETQLSRVAVFVPKVKASKK